MGFWHTGYIEFHEFSGLRIDLNKVYTFPCGECDRIFSSIEELREHRFSQHPLHRPSLFIRGKEIGSTTEVVGSEVSPDDIFILGADFAAFDSRQVSVDTLSRHLTQVRQGTHTVVLRKEGVSSTFTLEFRIPSQPDLDGVERCFDRLVGGRELSKVLISQFIDEAAPFESARWYCHGISRYLFGVLAKEGNRKYVEILNDSSATLRAYDRPLAKLICGLILFHFNHFSDAYRAGIGPRLNSAAANFVGWTTGEKPQPLASSENEEAGLERLLMDKDTEQIVIWASSQGAALRDEIIESATRAIELGPADFDEVKLRVLLGEAAKNSGDAETARLQARELRSRPGFERWAESTIEEVG